MGALVVHPTVRRPPRAQYFWHLVFMGFGAALMLDVFSRIPPLQLHLWPAYELFAPGFLLTAFGIGIALWARVHLGRFWSADIGSKSEHKLIETGPYARLRHPIYFGVSLAVLGTALIDGTLHALCGAVILVAALVAKARLEETWLVREFGGTYWDYRRRSWALIPFIY